MCCRATFLQTQAGCVSITPVLNQQVNIRNFPLGHIRELKQLTTIYAVILVEDMTRPKRVLVVNSAWNASVQSQR